MTSIRINLLPHRQMRRAHAQRMFAVMVVIAAGLGIAAVAFGQFWLDSTQEQQNRRNDFLRAETVKLDAQIAEIKQLKQQMQSLLDRKDVVESLQVNRGEAVRLFSTLAQQVPEGLYIKGLKQVGDEFTITGLAQSSARVSTFMRALEASDLFLEPRLVEVKSAQVDKLRLNEFTLKVNIERHAAEAEDAQKGATPAAEPNKKGQA